MVMVGAPSLSRELHGAKKAGWLKWVARQSGERTAGGCPAIGARKAHWGRREQARAEGGTCQKFPTMKSLKRPNAVFTEPLFCATLKPRRRARRASSSRPITVAARGWAIMSA